MRPSSRLAVLGSLLSAGTSARILSMRSATGSTPAQQACNYLHSHFPNATHFPNTTYYDTDNTDFWSQASALGPACDFVPSGAEDLGWGVKVLKYFNSPFAVRGGGHMPIEGLNNINSSGVLVSSSGFTQLRLEPDGQSVHVGPANHWVDVYRFLEPFGKVVIGGRLGVVGVPGFVTGGGISFFGWQHGWSSNNIKSFTGVIANTEMITYDAPVITLGITAHGILNGTASAGHYIDALYDFAVYRSADDGKASIIPIINTGNTDPFNSELSYTTYRFYDGNVSTTPEALKNFTSPNLPVVSDTFKPKTMYGWSEETGPQFSATEGLRQRFFIIPLFANKEALKIVIDDYFALIFDSLAGIEMWFASLSPIPVSKRFINASTGANGHGLPDGDPMGAAVDNYFWIEFAISYNNDPANEAIVTAFLDEVNKSVLGHLADAGLSDQLSSFIYLNDADAGQDVFGGYPKENVKKLQEIRQKYDSERVFTDLMPGGWKLADYVVSEN